MTTTVRPTLGFEVIDWLEAMLVRGPGDVQGLPLELDDEMREFILRAYELKPDGTRAYQRALLCRAKGRGKTEVAAALACAELLGPVRFDGLDANGDPVGVPVRGPEVLCIATEEQQSGLTYGAAVYMLQNGAAGDEYDLDVGLTRTFAPGGSVMRPVSSGASSKEGGRTTFAVCDETHLFDTPELRRLFATVRRNLGKRRVGDPWLLETSTAPAAGSDSVAAHTLDYWHALTERDVPDPDLLVDYRAAGEEHDLTTFEGRLTALREAFGSAAAWMPLDRLAREYDDTQVTEADWRRFWLNQVVAVQDAWLPAGAWERCQQPGTLEPGDRVTLGFDGSWSRDGTALVAVRIDDGFAQLLHLQEPAGERRAAGPDVTVDRDAVDAAMHYAMSTYKVQAAYCDPFNWHDALTRWEREFRRQRVRAWPTNRTGPMAAAVSRCETAILNRELLQDGDPRLTRHIANARRRERRSGVVIEKDAHDSPRRIDAAIALVLAWEARADNGRARRGGGLITF